MKISKILLTAGISFVLLGCGDDDDSSNNSNNTNNTNNQNPACEAFNAWLSDCSNCSANNCDSSWASLTASEKTDLEECITVFDSATICTDFTSEVALNDCVGAAQAALSLDCSVDPECGNGICETGEEMTCVMDCPTEYCGDGQCTGDENPVNCSQDCDGPYCGDGNCEEGEDATNCEFDCVPDCGNTYCTTGEDWQTCPQDCPKTACNYYEEWMSSCPGCAFSVDCQTAYDNVDMGTKAILDDCRTTFYSNRGTCDPTANQDLQYCVSYLETVFGYACE
ncbi:hypothetical protein KKF34_10735 [Myxococcota bacterium]|nr:hypothetical protein [Myxococcota bacterium]MBU1380365.1 hypothetical protein [Myxococcota bacterium]MBU1497343.1 hypothetical protein [Myxococcota bacterium]